MTYDLSIADRLRASHVKRWHIVNTTRTQSVAEHSFNVAMIAIELSSRLFDNIGQEVLPEALLLDDRYDPLNRLNVWQAFITRHALYHDIDEVVTGDMPGPVKHSEPWKVPTSVYQVGFAPQVVVKIADVIEQYVFIREYAMDSHARRAAKHMSYYYEAMMNSLGTKYESLVRKLASDIMNGDTRIGLT